MPGRERGRSRTVVATLSKRNTSGLTLSSGEKNPVAEER